jgi:hypothetical protein
VTPLVAGAVLAAAVTHASWNAIAHHVPDKLVGLTLSGFVYTARRAVQVGFQPFFVRLIHFAPAF